MVDAGLSCRETQRRMDRLGLAMDKVKAIFISHEHGDHIKGVEGIADKYKIPIYITPATLNSSRMRLDCGVVYHFTPNIAVTIGGLSILPFPKKHDAIDPHSFVIEGNGVKIGVFTDIGVVCKDVLANFKQCNAVFLEANYDEAMLAGGRYPHHLQNRITSGHGHISNRQALELFCGQRAAHLSHIFLSHLSKDNNCPDLALNLFNSKAGHVQIVIASRYNEIPLYRILPGPAAAGIIKKPVRVHARQATLF